VSFGTLYATIQVNFTLGGRPGHPSLERLSVNEFTLSFQPIFLGSRY
jgi:hypothetical protein